MWGEKEEPQSIDKKISQWVRDHKGATFAFVAGLIFLALGMGEQNTSLTLLMQTVLIFVFFLGMMVFIYNVGYLTIMLSVDEGLRDDEKQIVKWIIRRSAAISAIWFLGILGANIAQQMFKWNASILAAANCFLLAFLFIFIRTAENPLTEEISI